MQKKKKKIVSFFSDFRTIAFGIIMIVGFISSISYKIYSMDSLITKIDSLSADSIDIRQDTTEVKEAIIKMTQIIEGMDKRIEINRQTTDSLLQYLLKKK